MRSKGFGAAVVAVAALATVAVTPASAATSRLQRQLNQLVATDGGPPGVIVTIRRSSGTRVLTAGDGDLPSGRPPRSRDHMRIASVAKAFSAAVALRLVGDREFGLDDTIGELRPDLPAAWHGVTVRRLLNHTSGLPDYTKSAGFAGQLQTDPRGYVSTSEIISWVADKPLEFPPGARYEYSNTDNIVIGLIAEKATGRSYGRLLRDFVFRPLGLRQTSFPTQPELPGPYIHGSQADGTDFEDVSEIINPSGAWASGAIVSSPRDLNAFVRGYVGRQLFPQRLRRDQLSFVSGNSDPPGPGTNFAGLGLFRYRTKCGSMYGHTGSFPGYGQLAASSRYGSRSVTSSINTAPPAPGSEVLDKLRAMQRTLVCEALK